MSETLSAMMDDEAQELELRRFLRDMEAHPEERERWARYQLARAALQGDAQMPATGLADAVRSALEEESAESVAPGRGWLRTVGSFAVAASVTAVVLVGGQQFASTGADQQVRVGALPVGVINTVGAVPVQASFGNSPVPTLQPAERTAYRELARQRLRRYSLEHAEHAALNTPNGMLPFARVPEITPEPE